MYQCASELGNANAQNALGVFYQNGIGGVQEDKEKVVYYYSLAAEQGLAKAMFNLSNICGKPGYPKTVSGNDSTKWCEFAAEGGYEKAIRKLCEIIIDDKSTTSLENQINWLKMAVKDEQLGTKAKIALAMIYLKDGALMDSELAIEYLRSAIIDGDPDAGYLLGNLLEFGNRQIKVNMKEAFNVYYQTYEMCYAQGSKYCVAKCYYYGRGTRQNYEEAFEILSSVKETDYRYSKYIPDYYDEIRYMIGVCHLYGHGTSINSPAAFKIFSSLPNMDKAQYQLGKMYLKGLYVRKDKEKAREILKPLAKKGCIEARNLLNS